MRITIEVDPQPGQATTLSSTQTVAATASQGAFNGGGATITGGGGNTASSVTNTVVAQNGGAARVSEASMLSSSLQARDAGSAPGRAKD